VAIGVAGVLFALACESPAPAPAEPPPEATRERVPAPPTIDARRGDPIADRRAACLRDVGEVAAELQPVVAALCGEVAHHEVVGAQVAAVGPTGTLVSWAVGRRCVDGPERLTTRTRMRIGSITKALTAATVLHLHDEGRLDLEATLHDAAPELAVPGGDRIRIRNLLSHTAGLVDVDPAPHHLGLSPAALAAVLAEGAPVTPPGDRFAYANAGYVLLGLVLDARTGDAAAEIARTTLADTRGDFVPRADDACGHLRDGARWRAYTTTEDLELFAHGARFTSPAGGAIMSAEDLARALSRLAPRSTEAPTVPTGGADEESYGAGLRSIVTEDGARIWGHTGHTGDFTAEAWWVPDARIAVVVIVSGPRPLRATMLAALSVLGNVRRSSPGSRPPGSGDR
jgi:D-alanyl-D-alanine carboxypeptidase